MEFRCGLTPIAFVWMFLMSNAILVQRDGLFEGGCLHHSDSVDCWCCPDWAVWCVCRNRPEVPQPDCPHCGGLGYVDVDDHKSYGEGEMFLVHR